MLDLILGSLFGNKPETKKVITSNFLNRIKKRKLIIQKFKSIDPNNNLKRASIAKELLNVSKTEGERRAARKFYKDETALNNLKNKIKISDSINEKLSLARQGKRLATKQQKEFWENLVNKLQQEKKETMATDINMEKDIEEIKEDRGQEQEINNDPLETGKKEEAEEAIEEEENDDYDYEEEEEERDGTLGNNVSDENKNENLI